MEINITARHMDLTPALVDFIHKKISKVQKYVNDINAVHVILTCEKYRQIAQIVFNTFGVTFRAKETAPDLYAALDLVSDKIDMQLKKFKERRKFHHGTDKLFRTTLPAERDLLNIKKKESLDTPSLTVAEAVRRLEVTRKKTIVFRDTDTRELHLLEKKNNEFELTNIIVND